MKKLIKAIFGSSKEEKLRSLDSLSELQINDYIRLNDSFALPEELRGKTFQVVGIDSYYYEQTLSTEWVLKGDGKKKVCLSLGDINDEDQIVLSFQLKKKEVEALFGWDKIKQQYKPELEESLVCKEPSQFEGWLGNEYFRRECNAKGTYFSGDYRGKIKPSGGEELTYYEFFTSDESYGMDIEVWSKDEVDVFISVIRPESDIHEFWAG